jgi:hypothetical protein
MSAQLGPINAIAFASAFLASGLGISVPANFAFAVDCLTAPNSPASQNSHWYYRTDRTQERKCWHLGTDNGAAQRGAAQIVREAPTKASQSVAGGPEGPSFKDLVARQGGAKLSVQDVDRLYAEFLEWKRHAKN